MKLVFIRRFKLLGHAAQQSSCLGRQAVASQVLPGRGVVCGTGSAGAATVCICFVKLHSLSSGCMWQDCVGLHSSIIPWLLCALQATGRCMWQALSTSACIQQQQQQQQQSAREQARAQQQSLVKVCCSCSMACTAHFGHAVLMVARWLKDCFMQMLGQHAWLSAAQRARLWTTSVQGGRQAQEPAPSGPLIGDEVFLCPSRSSTVCL